MVNICTRFSLVYAQVKRSIKLRRELCFLKVTSIAKYGLEIITGRILKLAIIFLLKIIRGNALNLF